MQSFYFRAYSEVRFIEVTVLGQIFVSFNCLFQQSFLSFFYLVFRLALKLALLAVQVLFTGGFMATDASWYLDAKKILSRFLIYKIEGLG